MTISTSLALFVSMSVLALIPGPGVLAVVSRTLALGLRQGLIAVTGIVAGDYLFILLALFGMSTLAETMGSFFVIIKYAGAAFLIWLGVNLIFTGCKAKGPLDQVQTMPSKSGGNLSSFLLGLFTTMGNPKAILFYASFFPAFLDLTRVTSIDILAIFTVATLSVGSVMAGYAYFAFKAQSTIGRSNRGAALKYGSGVLLIGSGIFVAVRE
ncbi:LysE family translocator [Microbulbifer sp. OS29]|uniref:LysE family translocator n=1 Tax=Microbulbifer okhotskensis TaxID=2926617 RepID=A0A9X2J601_9GAMM|nr:LysE family translocator [Microbulbifer okhotskensis]MCO1336102.1 LysE family translocator [Microbulbifer okhotskensis]